MTDRFQTFSEFYSFYLSEHRDARCRRCHFLGTTLAIAAVVMALTVNPWFWLAAPFLGYGFAWIGHFGFEKNRPATFQYPLYSFLGDWVMFRDMITGRVGWR